MPSGFKRRRASGDEYIFIDGRAVRSDEAVRIEVQDAPVPGQAEAQSSGASAGTGAHARRHAGRKDGTGARTGRDGGAGAGEDAQDDAFALREDALALQRADDLFSSDRRARRTKHLAFAAALAVLVAVSLCISEGYYGVFYSPVDVVRCYAAWVHIAITGIADPGAAQQLRFDTLAVLPMYDDCLNTAKDVFKYVACGVLLALSGMLYQNTFRNPIAAPSMLGVTNGVQIAILVLVLQFGYAAPQMKGAYYLYAYVGGAAVLALVIAGGKYISGPKRFNVVNMLLVGTIVSQLVGVVLTYVQNTFLSDAEWDAFYRLQTATGQDSVWTYVSLAICLVVTIVPVVVYRFRLNLVAFDDAETRMLGADPNALRVLALVCGSAMILTAMVNMGQVAMASLVVPFVVRAVFGVEFRRQLVGNVLCGAFILLLAGDLASYFTLAQIGLDVGAVVTVCAMPLFVWMIAAGQRGWE